MTPARRPSSTPFDRNRFAFRAGVGVGVVVVACLLGLGADARAAGRRPTEAGGAFARGVRAFRGGDYLEAEKVLRAAAAKNDDWGLYLHAESAFYAGMLGPARADFERLSRMKRSRLAAVAAFRTADCIWSLGDHVAAAVRYRGLLGRGQSRPPPGVDVAVARFRVAVDADEQKKAEAARLFLALYRDLPAHPLATEARRHLPRAPDGHGGHDDGQDDGQGGSTGSAGSTGSSDGPPPVVDQSATATVADQLRRAEILTRDRHWPEALDELAKLPAALPPAQAIERDFQIGMTKFQMRRDYGKAAQLLLAVAPSLSGDKAASALFHGTRALSRIDRDDEAIVGYRQVVARFPQSRYAAEAQFLSGWLDYNRGRFRESLPGLLTTLERFGKSAFADDAAWCVAFAHFLLGELPQAASALDRYARMPPTGMTQDERAAQVAYWHARIDAVARRAEQARNGYREVNRRWPFSFYGVAARARLAELGEGADANPPRTGEGSSSARGKAPLDTKSPTNRGSRAASPSPSHAPSRTAPQLPVLVRADELAAAGLDVEAGWELQRDENSVLGRLGEREGLRVLLARYPTYQAFRRAYELGESRARAALAAAPEADADTRLAWQAAYPLAYRVLVERYGPQAGNPDLFLYAIMRKESGYSPWDVSTADARGLLQMIPPTSAKVAASLGVDFLPEELFDPEINIRLGASYIGALSKKFGGQIPIIAGAYNAGPKAMAKWCDQHGKHPTDEFVELIAFTQTREYAKRVVGIFARYRRLYGPVPYQMPLTVDPRYASAGPEY